MRQVGAAVDELVGARLGRGQRDRILREGAFHIAGI
jgi:hypothetical protein